MTAVTTTAGGTTALEAVATYLPSTRSSVASIGEELGLSATQIRLFRRFYGLDQVRLAPEHGLPDLLTQAGRRLEAPTQRVRYLVHARTLQVVAPHTTNPLVEVRDALGLRRADVFAVTQHACASGLLAVDIAGRLLAADGEPDALALVLTGEKTFTRPARFIPDTTIMGEGAGACLVRIGGTRDRLLAYATRTHGRYNDCLALSDELAIRFQREYTDSLAEVVRAAVERAGLDLDDIALVLPHNVNRISWVRLCRLLGFPVERVFLDNVPVTGHCFCADTFLNYDSARAAGRLDPGDHYVMASVGLGATFSAMVFRH